MSGSASVATWRRSRAMRRPFEAGPAAPGAAEAGRGDGHPRCNEMTFLGDWQDDMERFALDRDTADRLLSGVLEPEDAPHRYGEVASLLRIASGPTSGVRDGEAA